MPNLPGLSRPCKPAHPERIRNVEFRFPMAMKFATNHPQMRVEQAKFEKDCPIWFFGGRNVDPTSICNITIEYGKTEPGSSGLCMRNSLLRALKKFNDIKNVVVRLNKISQSVTCGH